MDNKLIRQHNAITEARYDMSALEKNIVYIMMGKFSDQVEETRYSMTISEIEKLKNQELKSKEISLAAKQLVKRNFMIYDTISNKFLGLKLFSSSKYFKGQLTLEIDKRAIPFFGNLKKNFTTLDLKIALCLRSIYSKRIYEMLCQYKDTGVLNITVYELKCRLGLIDMNTKKEKYVEFALFKKYILEQAKKELSKKAEFSFTYNATKTGKKYTNLHFKISEENTKANFLIAPEKSIEIEKEQNDHNLVFNKLTIKYKLSIWQAQKILEKVPLQEIHKTTYDIQLELINNKVHNIGGYTAKIFDEKYNLSFFK